MFTDETEAVFLLPFSGQDCGSGPGVIRREQWSRHFRSRTEDKEGNVSNCRPTLQRVSHQADGHAEEHQPQLPSMHHPQPREEGETRGQKGHKCSKLDKNLIFLF